METYDLGSIPECAGCYQFYAGERCLYVGKAVDLRQRLSSYFTGNRDPRIADMVAKAERVEWVVLPSETDALLVEAAMITELDPMYNIKLREDHPYPSVAIDERDGVARIVHWRGPRIKGVETFGPYPGGGARNIIDAVIDVAKIRSCDRGKYKLHQRLKRPCLLAEVDRCSAPCVGNVEAHTESVLTARSTLKGRTREIIERLGGEMKEEAAGQKFEQAGKLRDKISGLEAIRGAQMADDTDGRTLAAIGTHLDGVGGAVSVLEINNGAVVRTRFYVVERGLVDERSLLEAAVRSCVGYTTVLIGAGGGVIPGVRSAKSTRDGRIVAIADMNAGEALRRARLQRASGIDARREELHKLQQALGLKKAPLRIEGVDISHLGGAATVSVVALLVDGLPVRNRYRKYRLKDHGGDDYAAMREVLTRRIADSIDDKAPYMDLLLIDGGRNQLAVAVEVLNELGVADKVEVASLAKRLEEVYRPGREEAVILKRSDPALLLLQRARDETHTASNKFQKQVSSKRLRTDYLDGVKGLGEKRKNLLLAQVGGWRGLEEVSRENLEKVTGVPESVREEVWQTLVARRGEQQAL
jgi:excinuclease ABC subunit C